MPLSAAAASAVAPPSPSKRTRGDDEPPLQEAPLVPGGEVPAAGPLPQRAAKGLRAGFLLTRSSSSSWVCLRVSSRHPGQTVRARASGPATPPQSALLCSRGCGTLLCGSMCSPPAPLSLIYAWRCWHGTRRRGAVGSHPHRPLHVLLRARGSVSRGKYRLAREPP